ncbi:S-layer homology domain-containing protein [Cohnella nanjingensis]|uniref:S-layer homology domain-containing protein n=1 Tax=Cohnella nanjingensis TaxID=1387779 RepID=A0A7X0RTG9_9BACL|nr:S-layer homology domain-containing protein [Cohnella nanjingensis]MBB6671884.1 S-layer homology domain-containing protein [Cohnella nanjingensis]
MFAKMKWKKPLNLLLASALTTGLLSAAWAPQTAKAAPDPVYPGGVSNNLHLWLRAEDGVTAANGTVSEWKDQSGHGRDFSQADPAKQPAYNDDSNRLNFNKAINFDGTKFLQNANGILGNNTSYDNFNVFIISGTGNTSNSVFWENTAGGGRFQVHLPYGGVVYWDAGNQGGQRISTPGVSAEVGKYYIWNFNYGLGSTTDAGQSIYRNGESLKFKAGQPADPPIKGIGNPMVLGREIADQGYYKGQVGEFIFYSGPLTVEDRQKINSYLAIKYGVSLSNVNYVDSKANVIWQADADYNNNIAGIARDDGQGLQQKQSRSANDASKLTIGIGALSEKNEAITEELQDKQSLVWGDNGKNLTFNTPMDSANKNYADRIWKVQNTNGVGDVQISILKSAVPADAILVVSDSADFKDAKEYTLTETSLSSVAYYTTTTKVALANDQFFTYAIPVPGLDRATLEQVVAGQKQITLSFDQDLRSLTDLNGFVIKVGTATVTLNAGDYQLDPTDPKKLILTLPNGTDVTGKTVSVSYDGTGTLKGTNGRTAHPFTMNAIDSYADALSITKPGADPVAVGKPTIEGTVEPGSTVNIVIKDSNGNPVTGAGGAATVDGNGNWTFVPNVSLTDGNYKIEATAVKNNRTATKSSGIQVAIPEPTLTVTEPSGDTVYVPKPEVKGTADKDAAVTVTIKDKDGHVVDSQAVTVNPDGTWSFQPGNDLVDGDYTVEVTATKDGKTSKQTKNVAINTSLPALTITEPSGNTVSVPKPVVKGTADPGAAVTVTIKDKNDQVVDTQAATVNPDGTWSFQAKTDLADGDYTVEATATKDGKTSTQTKPITVDTANRSSLTGLELKGWNGTPIELAPVAGGVENQYTASVSNSVYAVTALPTALDPNAKIEVSVNNGTWQEVPNGAASGDLNLNVGPNTIVVKVTDSKGNVTEYKLTVTRASGSGENPGGPGGPTTTPTPTPTVTPKPGESGIETSVNGNNGTFATGTTSTSGDRTVTSVQVDLDKLAGELAKGNGQKLGIRSPKDGDVKVDGLTAGTVKQIADKGASLEISNPLAIYPVPGGKMDLNGVSKQLNDAGLGDIAVHIDIARSSDAVISNAKNQAAAEGYELLVTPVDLDLSFSHDGKTVRSEQLNGYAAKYIALPDGIDPNRITTGVIINEDGSVYHVPTVVTKVNNRYYALINDLRSHGTYSVIWNPQDFDDVKNHWGKADVNNIAARLDLAGTGNNTFSPNRNVTRSEFSEIVVNGLGLLRQNAPQNKFSDVPDSAWYRKTVSIANEFDIVRGFNDGQFYGNRQITREQGIAMIARAYQLIEPKAALGQDQIDSLLAKYEDAKNVSAWAREDVARMIEAGIVQGNGPQLLTPQSNMTRAEVTALIARLLKTTTLIDK